MLKPCLSCGLPSEQSRCPEHRPKDTRDHRARGYDAAWDRLSQRARRLQRFCSDCGTTYDLQCDHSPEAWQRKAEGKPIRLEDVDVVCGPCNRRRGSARPGVLRRSPKNPEPDLRGTRKCVPLAVTRGYAPSGPDSAPVGKAQGALLSKAEAAKQGNAANEEDPYEEQDSYTDFANCERSSDRQSKEAEDCDADALRLASSRLKVRNEQAAEKYGSEQDEQHGVILS